MAKHMKEKFLKQASHEYRPQQRIAALAFEAVIFLFLLPLVLVQFGAAFNRWFGWPVIRFPPVNAVLGGLAILGGWLFAVWSIYAQFTIGRGTPVPLMATQKLIVRPAYAYCRNPMALGTIVMYLGVAVLFGSPGAGLVVLLFAGLLLSYIKRLEEREMELRFGEAYRVYRQQTPFLFPRFH